MARLLGKHATKARVVVRNEALNASEPERSANVLVKLLTRKADNGDDAATIEAIMSATPFGIEGGELQIRGTAYDIISVVQTGVESEHILQRAVLRER